MSGRVTWQPASWVALDEATGHVLRVNVNPTAPGWLWSISRGGVVLARNVAPTPEAAREAAEARLGEATALSEQLLGLAVTAKARGSAIAPRLHAAALVTADSACDLVGELGRNVRAYAAGEESEGR